MRAPQYPYIDVPVAYNATGMTPQILEALLQNAATQAVEILNDQDWPLGRPIRILIELVPYGPDRHSFDSAKKLA